MREHEGVRDLAERLSRHYDDKTVVQEPAINGGSLRPDIVVYADENHDQPLLVVEYKTSLSYRRRDKAFEQLDSYLRALKCEYGAVVTPSLEYVFEREPQEGLYERSIGGFPVANGYPPRRPLATPEEARFLINRVADLYKELIKHESWTNAIFQVLLQKQVADEMGRDPPVGDLEVFETFLHELDDEIASRHDAYAPVEYSDYWQFARNVFALFNGYELTDLPKNVAAEFYRGESLGSSEASKYRTLPSLSGPIVDLADVDGGTSVLDPAAGVGGIAREAAAEGADTYAIEVRQEAVNTGTFLTSVVGSSIKYVCADFFEVFSETITERNTGSQSTFSDRRDSGEDPDSDHSIAGFPGPGMYDRIVLDPPIGTRVPAEHLSFTHQRDRDVRIEVAFVASALELLEPDGVLVAIVPETILAGEQTRQFREYLLSDYSVESIITFEASVYSGAEAKTGLIKIRNERPAPRQDVAIASVDDSSGQDFTERLQQAVEEVSDSGNDTMQIDRQTNRTLLPKQVVGQTAVRENIQDKYENVESLKQIAAEVIGGVSKPAGEKNTNDDNLVPFLSPIDLEDNEPVPPLVSGETARVTADQSDLLLRVKGEPLIVHHPDSEVVPSSDWAVVRFESSDEAKAYRAYFESQLAEEAVSANRRGSIVPYITISALQDLLIPVFDGSDGDES